MRYYVIEPCASANGVEIKLKERRIALPKAQKALAEMGEIVAAMPVVVVARVGGYSVSVYGSGRIMLKTTKKPRPKDVNALAVKLMSALEKAGAVL